MKHYSIRFTILSTFLMVTGLITAIALSLHYYFSFQLAEEAAELQFIEIAEESSQRALELERRGINLTYALQSNLAILETINEQKNPSFLKHLGNLMHENDGIFSVFIGYPNGDYLEISNLDASEHMRKIWRATDKDRWVVTIINQVDNERIKETHYLDRNLQKRISKSEKTEFISFERPWYKQATSISVNKTLPYKLSFAKQAAISYSIKTEQNLVVGSITLLSSIENLLNNKKYPETSQSFIFDNKGLIIASQATGNEQFNQTAPINNNFSDNEGFKNNKQLLPSALLNYASNQQSHNDLLEIDFNNSPNYLFVKPIKGFEDKNRQEYIGLLVSKQEVIQPYEKQLLISLAIMLTILLLVTPIISFAVKLIVKPINRLIVENTKVSNREFDQVMYVPTYIQELHELSGSLVSMSKAICAYAEAQKELLDSFIKLIAQAIDEKSPYTGGHCERVPKLAMLLAETASEQTTGPFKDFEIKTDEEWREFQVAAWLHDCGKITTPEHIVDKGSKLEAIYNRIHEIRMRFEVLLRDSEIEYWQKVNEQPKNETALKAEKDKKQNQIKEDFAFVAACNVGGEFMDDEQIDRLNQIAKTTWTRYLDNRLGLSPEEERSLNISETTLPQTENLLADKPEHISYRADTTKYDGFNFTLLPPKTKQNLGEIYNLSIRRGTLTDEDRFIINEHIISTIRMLETLPLPSELSNVPEYAGGHHEAINGNGYPRGLKGESLSIPARIMAIADIFEALTAADRPYKKAKTLSQSLNILKFMAKDGHIDKNLYQLFIQSEAYMTYAKQHLAPEQIDEVHMNSLLEDIE